MLLILFWISFLMFYFSYMFSVVFFIFLIMLCMLMYMSSMIFVKYLVVLVYISGIVIFILYISCLCWNVTEGFSKIILFLGFFGVFYYDSGVATKFIDIGEFLWMYLFFGFLFNSLVMAYSLNLYKVSGSLRF